MRHPEGTRLLIRGGSTTNPLTPLLITPYNRGKPQYPLISPVKPITARFVVRVHIGEPPENNSGIGKRGGWGEEAEMSSRSSALCGKPQATPTKVSPTKRRPELGISPVAKSSRGCITGMGCPPGGGEVDAVPLTKIIALLSPEHQRIVEAMVRELAKLEGIKAPTGAAESEAEPLSHYIPAWQNSLATRGFSPGSMDLYRRNVERLLANVPPPITTIAIEGYIASRRETLSPNALKNELKAAKSFFAFLHDRDIILTDPAAKIQHPKIVIEEKAGPTEDEIAKFLPVLAQAKNPRAKVMLFLFMTTGIRFTEMATLTWGRINLDRREIRVLGKGNKWRKIPLRAWVRDFLAQLRDDHADDEMLFPTKSKKGKWDNSDANKMIARLCRRAGIKRCTCHQFRHYFATHTLRLGGKKTLKALQEMLGHKRAATTLDFYVHTDEEEIRETHEAFAPLPGGVGLLPKEDKGGSHGQTD
ncbi:Tyrosine recombinase XerC [subsurface metagenome]